MKRIAFCTTCKGRTQHIRLTLPKNLSDNKDYDNAVFVLLDYGSKDGLLDYITANHIPDVMTGRLVVYSFQDDGPFKMAHAKNMAHRLGILENAEILVNVDADNYTGKGFAHRIDKHFRLNGDDTFMWANMNMFVKGKEKRPRGVSGRIIVTVDAFLKAGGYDEKYNEWSPDDKDFNSRISKLGYTGFEIDREYLGVVTHNDKMRFREYPHLKDMPGGEEAFKLSKEHSSAVANFGRVGIGDVIRRDFRFTWSIKLRPFPTRIFGIGMHKTGTTSLNAALKLLGIDSAHWQGAHWAKAIWREMNQYGWSETLERHYALCDLPMTLLYERLDKAYPGSKFILTTRNEETWLNSVRKHWDPAFNKFREGWDRDPFTNRVHQILYGQTNFDEGVFLNRFRTHNESVLEYFKDRPNDLLVLDMDSDVKWEPLCLFLDKKLPIVEYPREFVTGG